MTQERIEELLAIEKKMKDLIAKQENAEAFKKLKLDFYNMRRDAEYATMLNLIEEKNLMGELKTKLGEVKEPETFNEELKTEIAEHRKEWTTSKKEAMTAIRELCKA